MITNSNIYYRRLDFHGSLFFEFIINKEPRDFI
jgi:hypothetical protein